MGEENKKPENPDAFPFTSYDYTGDGCHEWVTKQGMTLRDYFAANSMQASIGDNHLIKLTYEERSEFAYKQADAMLKQREK